MLTQVRFVCTMCYTEETREIDSAFQLTPRCCAACESGDPQGYESEDDPYYSHGNIRELKFE